MLDTVSVNKEITDRLGEETLDEVCAHLWAIDCQTCGHPFRNEIPSLCIDDAGLDGYAATATLHHQTCRASTWSDHRLSANGPHTTYLTQCVLVPDEWFGGSSGTAERLGSSRPTIIVNQWAEMVGLERSDEGRWRLLTNIHHYLGMRPLGQGYVIGRPITAGYVTLQPTTVTAHLATHAWSAPTEPWFADRVRQYLGITLWITHALGPGRLKTALELLAAIADGHLELGWLAVR
jgi:hypothetical protein